MTDAVVVSARGARRWANGHPWIFRSDVVRFPTDASRAGSLKVEDQRGRPLGLALYSPQSEISLRLIDKNIDAVLDEQWWVSRISAALQQRGNISRQSSGYRVVHAEGDALPSFVCDRYGEYVVVQLLSAGLEVYREEIISAVQQVLAPQGILARHDVAVREREGLPRGVELIVGEVPQDVEIEEHGVRYLAAPWDGQKTGAFLDQRENRAMAGAVASGRALDCFSYHGSFALHLAGAAQSVVAVDSSAPALERAMRNAELNGFGNIITANANAFDYLRDCEARGDVFDTIVVDPPAFAKNRGSLPAAIRGYKELNLRAMRLLAPGGYLLSASCSFHLSKSGFLEMLSDAAADSGRRIVLREVLGQPADHPEILTIPETGYLKGALLQAFD